MNKNILESWWRLNQNEWKTKICIDLPVLQSETSLSKAKIQKWLTDRNRRKATKFNE